MKPQLYVIRKSVPLSQETREKMLSLTDKARKIKIKNMKNQDKADSMLLGDILIRTIAKKEYGLPSSRLTVSYTEKGKPYFKDEKNLHFSISHSGEYIVVAFFDAPIGVDIEKIGNFKKEVAERVCSEYEMNEILSSERPASAFTMIWTKKEAVLKKSGSGILTENIKHCLYTQKTESEQLGEYWISVAAD